ncbi:MAG: prolipoprotein diacylglyceryl transferase [Actinobacteria bacterium]|nr:prolipoprotein diacylglyceryl transferase [Actinomycetota bacterium]
MAALSWPILERIPLFGDAAISPHGLGIAAGFLLGGWMMSRRAQRWGIGAGPDEDVGDAVSRLLTWVAIGGIVGARLFYVLNHLPQYAGDPLSVLAVWHGGLTLLGGIVGGSIAGMLLVRRSGWRGGLLADAAAPGLAAGIAVGRFGDLAIGDHIGAPAPNLPFAWRCTGNLWERATNTFGYVPPQPYPAGASPVQGCFDVPVIQTALLDVVAASVALVVVSLVERRMRRRPVGTLAATFVAVYGIGRLGFDFFRADVRYAGLTASQWTAMAAVALAVAWLARARTRPADMPGQPDPATPPSSSEEDQHVG